MSTLGSSMGIQKGWATLPYKLSNEGLDWHLMETQIMDPIWVELSTKRPESLNK